MIASLLACLLAVLTIWNLEVNGAGIALIKQENICKRLKTIKKNGTWGGIVYVADPKVPNNTLDEAFYIRQGYGNMTCDRFYDEIARIYNETTGSNCKNPLCECINSYENHDYDDHRFMFRNRTILTQAKEIVAAFIRRYRNYSRPVSEIKKFADKADLSFPLVLIQLFLDCDYSFERFYAYNDIVPKEEFIYRWGRLDGMEQNFTAQISCEMATIFANRNLVTRPNNTQLEQKFICELINAVKKPVEVQHFYALNLLATSYPTLNLGGQNLKFFFNRLLNISAGYKPQALYSNIDFITVSTAMMIVGYKTDNLLKVSINASNVTLCVFDSPTLRINVERVFLSSSQTSKMRVVNFTFTVEQTTAKPSVITYSLNLSRGLGTQNGTIVQTSQKKNLYQVLELKDTIEVYDYNSNSRISILNTRDLKITAEIKLLNSATGGVMITGFGSNLNPTRG